MPELEFTLKDLAKIALGAPDLTQVSLALLHTLINILLKKLDCENEKVSIGGFESRCLEKLLKESQISSLPFKDDHVDVLPKKIEKLEGLEDRIEIIGTKLEKHLQAIRDCNKMKGFQFRFDKYEEYCMPCEDICTACDPENEIACSLLQNTDFLRKMMRMLADPMVKRILILESKIAKLNREFIAFMERMEERFEKIAMMEMCIIQIEELRKKVDSNHSVFIQTMEEVQEMLDAKLDKVHVPVLKKFIKTELGEVNKKLQGLEEKQTCPRAAGVIIDGIKCLSCGNTKVCADKSINPIGLTHDARKQPGKCPKKCQCDSAVYTGTDEPTLIDYVQNIESSLLNPVTKKHRETRKSCRLIGSTNKYRLTSPSVMINAKVA